MWNIVIGKPPYTVVGKGRLGIGEGVESWNPCLPNEKRELPARPHNRLPRFWLGGWKSCWITLTWPAACPLPPWERTRAQRAGEGSERWIYAAKIELMYQYLRQNYEMLWYPPEMWNTVIGKPPYTVVGKGRLKIGKGVEAWNHFQDRIIISVFCHLTIL